MVNPGLPTELWAILDGRLWHATGPNELAGIIENGEISVFRHRYNNSVCKTHDGVSLFDFGPTATDTSNQFNNWVGWMGHQQDSRVAVWLEIDREYVSANLLDAAATLELWRSQSSLRTIPGVEACHLGAISFDAIVSVLLIDRHDYKTFLTCDMTRDIIAGSLARFERSLAPAQPESEFTKGLTEALERAKQRK